MLKIALTGGIATGKSYVLDQFRRRGVPCLDADELAHGVTAAGTEATAAIAARFGADVLAADGSVDRAEARPDRVRRRRPRAASSRRSCTRPSTARSPPACARFELMGDGRSPSSTSRCCSRPARENDFDQVIVTACAPETQLARLRERGLTRRRRAPAPRGAVARRRRRRRARIS